MLVTMNIDSLYCFTYEKIIIFGCFGEEEKDPVIGNTPFTAEDDSFIGNGSF